MNIKLCKDCKYFQHSYLGTRFHKCLRGNGTNVVDGSDIRELRLCNMERELLFFADVMLGCCGSRGRYWTSKN